MENGYDTPYILNRFWQGNTVPDFYLLAKDEIERRGHISFTCDEENVNVYQPILAYIFKASRVSVRNMDTMEDIEIDGLPYLKTFTQGYQEGINYFEHDFKALYSPFDTDELVAAIKSNYFDTRLEKEGKIGWEKVKKFVPVNLNHKTIKEEGYFSGIVSRVEDIVNKHPQLFRDFYDKKDDEQIENVVSLTKKVISNHFEIIDKNKGWGYAFTSESDYNTFVNLLTNYFEYKPYSLPQKKIKLKKDTKTRLAKVLSPIYKQLSNENKKLKSDTDFFAIVRVLDHFEKLTDTQIYQAITR